MAVRMILRWGVLLATLAPIAVLPGSALATRKASRAEARAIAVAAPPSNNAYFRGGRIGWVEVSTAGP